MATDSDKNGAESSAETKDGDRSVVSGDGSCSLPSEMKIDIKISGDSQKSEKTEEPRAPWWMTKLVVPVTIAILTGLFTLWADIWVSYKSGVDERARLEEIHKHELTLNILSDIAKPEVGAKERVALYGFLAGVSEPGSRISEFAKGMQKLEANKVLENSKSKDIDLKKNWEAIEEASTRLPEETDETAIAHFKDPDDDISVLHEKRHELERDLQSSLDLYDVFVGSDEVSKDGEITIVRNWSDIELGKSYYFRSKLGGSLSFVLYKSRPSGFGKFGKRVSGDMLTEEEVFKVKEKEVTFRGYKWLGVELKNQNDTVWFSWENVRSETILSNSGP